MKTMKSGGEPTKAFVYSLSTCSLCKDLKKSLEKNRIPFDAMEVDLLEKDKRNEVMDLLKALDPVVAFPTLVAGDEMVIGYNREKIAEVIKKIRPQGRFSLRRFFSGQPG
jgi:glutaredoxin